jgi:hypothetical protein
MRLAFQCLIAASVLVGGCSRAANHHLEPPVSGVISEGFRGEGSFEENIQNAVFRRFAGRSFSQVALELENGGAECVDRTCHFSVSHRFRSYGIFEEHDGSLVHTQIEIQFLDDVLESPSSIGVLRRRIVPSA